MSGRALERGYTIIEILVVMLIMGLFIGSGTAGYRQFQQRQVISSFTNQFIADLRLAQSMSFTGEKHEDCTDVLTAIRFDVVPGNPQRYTIEAICNASPSPAIIKDVTLDKDSVRIQGPKRDVFFLTVGGGTDIPAGSEIDWWVRDLVSGIQERVFISSTGAIRVE